MGWAAICGLEDLYNHMKMTLIMTVLVACITRADDWPQWLGPQRDSIWRETGVVEKFSAGGPPVLWRAPLGGGYAGPAVADGRVFVTDRVLPVGASNPADPSTRSGSPIDSTPLDLSSREGAVSSGTVSWTSPRSLQ